jgi:hypothetical protein
VVHISKNIRYMNCGEWSSFPHQGLFHKENCANTCKSWSCRSVTLGINLFNAALLSPIHRVAAVAIILWACAVASIGFIKPSTTAAIFLTERDPSSERSCDACDYSLISEGKPYRLSQEERSIFWEVIVSVILSKKLYMYMCPIPNGLRDKDI